MATAAQRDELLEQAKAMLRYEPESGRLYWLSRDTERFASRRAWNAWNKRFAGSEAFRTKNSHGYLVGTIQYRRYVLAHRVAWAIHYGDWPSKELDHINGVRTDNRIENLRSVSRQENARNRKSAAGASSRFVGVSWHVSKRKWQARITNCGQVTHLGLFENETDAARAYADASLSIHGPQINPRAINLIREAV